MLSYNYDLSVDRIVAENVTGGTFNWNLDPATYTIYANNSGGDHYYFRMFQYDPSDLDFGPSLTSSPEFGILASSDEQVGAVSRSLSQAASSTGQPTPSSTPSLNPNSTPVLSNTRSQISTTSTSQISASTGSAPAPTRDQAVNKAVNAGIGIGSIIGAAVVAALVFYFIRHRKAQVPVEEQPKDIVLEKSELDADSTVSSVQRAPVEMEVQALNGAELFELPVEERPGELDGARSMRV
jgi:hypothetical protein